ncbi:MAG: hypothetical protein NTW38_01635 [Candidatus Aminicenantes bacterium]|nr:hypothetical protein [Candidatus Aminicenantes bacterium]
MKKIFSMMLMGVTLGWMIFSIGCNLTEGPDIYPTRIVKFRYVRIFTITCSTCPDMTSRGGTLLSESKGIEQTSQFVQIGSEEWISQRSMYCDNSTYFFCVRDFKVDSENTIAELVFACYEGYPEIELDASDNTWMSGKMAKFVVGEDELRKD